MIPVEKNTFAEYFEEFPRFLRKILAWKPDYVVPVAKKACKLLNTLPDTDAFRSNPDLIKYRNYFKFTNCDVRGKRIAVVDDATQYTSTLQEYRRYFENLGAIVRTFSFVGHEEVVQGARWKEDPLAEIAQSLPEPAYQEYILQQSYHLLQSGNHFDLDHLVFACSLTRAELEDLFATLRRHGLLLFVDDHRLQTDALRFSLNDAHFFKRLPFLNHASISGGPLRKLKLDYNPGSRTLFFSPLVFPTWHFNQCDVGAGLFQNVPFALPFEISRTLDKKNEGALLRTYTNMCFVASVGFAKAFVQHVLRPNGWMKDLRLRRNDLDAVIGFTATERLVAKTTAFVTNSTDYNFQGDVGIELTRSQARSKPTYSNFGQVIDDLKRGYEYKLKKKRSRIGVHYYFTYDYLFRRFQDRAALSEGLDYYCDFGIIVPETIVDRRNGQIARGCRAGEPIFDYNWRRTQVLIPLAIDLFLGKENRLKGIEPTLLNKVLANFVFDYPAEIYPQLHCLTGEPYLYGTFIRAHHPQRAYSKPSLYEALRISDFYVWNRSKNAFFVRQPTKLAAAARQVLTERQEVPYSQIVSYFRFLRRAYSVFKKSRRFKRPVDVLNMFSICGDESHFLSHVIFNVTRALEDIGLTFGENRIEAAKAIREAREQAEAAADKLHFSTVAKEAMGYLHKEFASDLEFGGVAARFERLRNPFGETFLKTREMLCKIVNLEIAFTELRSVVGLGLSSHLSALKNKVDQGTFADFGLATHDDLATILEDKKRYAEVCDAAYAHLRHLHACLPRPEPFLLARLHQAWLERARNIATNYVYERDLNRVALLHIDFTGLRSIPEPKEEMVAKYYEIVVQNSGNRSGEIIYGGDGGDDAFTIVFQELGPALECAKDIKAQFGLDLFLRAEGRDVKFGVAFALLPDGQKEVVLLEAWAEAKECCEFKSNTFRNRGHLLVSSKTLENLKHGSTLPSIDEFPAFGNEALKNGLNLLSFKGITPLH